MRKFLKFANVSLVNKLLLLSVVGISMAMVVVLFLMSTSYYYFARQSLSNEIAVQANLLATNVAPMIGFYDVNEARKLALSFEKLDDIQRVRIFDKDNSVLVDLFSSPETGCVGLVDGLALRKKETVKVFRDGCLNVYVPVIIEEDRVGVVILESSTQGIRTNILGFVTIGSIATFVGIILSAFILKKLQRTALDPIMNIAKLAERVRKEKNYSLRVAIQGEDEISMLGRQFNHMLDRIELWDRDQNEEILQRKESEKRLDSLARTDELTGLPNRLAFKEDIENAIDTLESEERLFVLMIIDLDDFKMVNDKYGHHAGDFVLQLAAKKIGRALREQDTLYRLGGDEFAALVYDIDVTNQVDQVCRRIIEKAGEIIHLKNEGESIAVTIGASVGASFFPLHATTTYDLFHCADIAMYASKKKGKDSFQVYNPGLDNEKENERKI